MPSSNRAESSLRLFKTSPALVLGSTGFAKLDNWNLPLALSAISIEKLLFDFNFLF